jgi:serine/threonine kinase PknH
MDSVDFAVNPNNQTTSIPGYSQAKAHYRPGYTSVAATMASSSYVASIFVSSTPRPELSYLTQRIKTTFDLLGPLVAKLLPTLETQLTLLPLDPDHMLSRLLVAGEQPKVSATFGSLGPLSADTCADPQALKDGLFGQAGIDLCAFSNNSQLLRAKDETAATTILPKLVEAERSEYVDHDVAPPDGLPSTRCYEQKQDYVADHPDGRFACWLSFGRYVATVSSSEEKDVRRRAAAQYAILVNSD